MLLLALALVIASEAAIMVALARLFPAFDDSPLLPLVDALGLALVLAPALWVLVVRPLQALAQQRGVLLARIFEVQEQERSRIARDLHDELGQQLTAVLLSLRAAEHAPPGPALHECVRRARAIAGESLESVRRLARGLAPVALADLGLRVPVERLCENIRAATPLEVHCELHVGDERLAPTIEIGVYRVLQEALTNVTRHARATRVAVRLERDGDALQLSVADDGTGIPPRSAAIGSAGLGLQSMRERVAALDGTFRVERAAGSGTIVTARVPPAFTT